MSKKNSFSAAYRRMSSALLNLAVSPHILGDIPAPLRQTLCVNRADRIQQSGVLRQAPAAGTSARAGQSHLPGGYGSGHEMP